MIGRRRERAIDSWRTALRRTGRVEIESRRWLVLLVALLCGVTGGLFLVAAAALFPSVGLRLATALLGLGMCGMAALLVKTRSRGPALVVDREAIHVVGQGMDLPWSAVRGVNAIRVRGTALVYADVDPAYKQEMLRDRGRLLRAVHRIDDTITLGALLRADPHGLATWLDAEARRR